MRLKVADPVFPLLVPVPNRVASIDAPDSFPENPSTLQNGTFPRVSEYCHEIRTFPGATVVKGCIPDPTPDRVTVEASGFEGAGVVC